MIREETTEDGSTTFFNEEFKQCYHSKVGAYTEALGKYVIPCEIEKLAKENETIKILDVCFGLGYNSGVTIEKALAVNPNLKIEITGLENDPMILEKIKDLKVPESYVAVREILSKLKDGIYENENIRIRILIGDARKKIKEIPEERIYDAVFFDPFSPKECPELWELSFIKEVVKRTKPGSFIATYSAARVVKENFKNAGCEVSEGPKVGRRSGGVLASVFA